ncbi:MAG: UPF0104 family protein [Archaeoglobaceae archaeon]
MGWKSATLGVLLSLLTMYVIFKLTETSLTWQTLTNLNPIYLLLAFVLQVIFWVFWAVRLRMITLYTGFRISYFYSLKITLSSMFVAAITPSSAGGEPVRIKMVSDKGVPIGASTLVVLTERILDSLFFATALPIFLILTGFSTALGFKVAILFSIILLSFIYLLYHILKNEHGIKRFSQIIAKIVRKKGFEEKVERELRNFKIGTQILSKPRKLVHLFSLTAMMWSAGFMMPSSLLIAMNSDPQYLLSYTSQLILVIISLIPITPGSSGLVEVTMAYLYSNFVPFSILGSLIVIWRFITYHMNIIFGLIALNISAIGKFFGKRS